MINIVFVDYNKSLYKDLINEIKKYYYNVYKIGFNEDLDMNSKLCKDILHKLYNDILEPNKYNKAEEKALLSTAEYLYNRDLLYSQNNDINFFTKSVFSSYTGSHNDFVNKLIEYSENNDNGIDLLVFFDEKVRGKEKKEYKYIKDNIRYYNSYYKLLIIEKDEDIDHAVKKVVNKIDEITKDKNKSEDNKWYELYKIDVEEYPIPDDYFKYKLKYKKKFVKKVIKYAEDKKVLEAGCGTGLMAGYLQRLGFDVVALDLSQKVLDYAKEIATDSNIISPCRYDQGDILNLKYDDKEFDVVFSNGVLEHFNDNDLIKILSNQMRISKYVIFGIPSTYFGMNEKMLGNERSLTTKEWNNIIKKAGGRVVEYTTFHYYKLYRRITEAKKWFRPKAFLLFIIAKDEEGR